MNAADDFDVSAVLVRLGAEYDTLRARNTELRLANGALVKEVAMQRGVKCPGAFAACSGSDEDHVPTVCTVLPQMQVDGAVSFAAEPDACAQACCSPCSPSRVQPSGRQVPAVIVPEVSAGLPETPPQPLSRSSRHEPPKLRPVQEEHEERRRMVDYGSGRFSAVCVAASERDVSPRHSCDPSSTRATLAANSLKQDLVKRATQHEEPSLHKKLILRTLSKARSATLGSVGSVYSPRHSFDTQRKERIRVRLMMLDSALAVLVILNTITIGVSADMSARHPFLWVVIDAIFASLFLIELLFKLWLTGVTEYFCGSEWRWGFFEAGLVVSAVLEVVLAMGRLDAPDSQEGDSNSKLSLLRMVRLIRITRVLRLVRLDLFSELMVMIKGTLGGIRTLGWSIVLISLPLYIVALLLRETLGEFQEKGQGAEQFASVPTSFFTVFRCVVAGECTEAAGRPIFLSVTSTYGWGYGVLYCCTMVFMTFGLFNVIVAIFVENVIAGAKFNEHIKKQTRLRDRQLFLDKTVELLQMLSVASGRNPRSLMKPVGADSLPELENLELTPELFEVLRQQEGFQSVLRELDIADEDQFDLFDTLDVDGSGTVDINELLAGIAKLRGDPRRSDIVAVSLLLRSVQAELREYFKSSLELLKECVRHQRTLASSNEASL